jgi:RimJ/RimL family protein N-acetyltransferase
LNGLVRVRAAHVDDAPQLAAAERETARTSVLLRSLPEELNDDAFAQRIEWLEAPGNHGRYLVALNEQNLPIGHALLDPLPLARSAHIFRLTIVVHPGHTNRGVGVVLMSELLEWARRSRRVEKIELLVRSSNVRAIRLYRSFGFLEEGRLQKAIKLEHGRYVDDLAMALFL